MSWILRFISVEMIVNYVIKIITGITPAQIERIKFWIIEVSDEALEGAQKKYKVVEKVKDFLDDEIMEKGEWVINFIIESLVAVLKSIGKIKA